MLRDARCSCSPDQAEIANDLGRLAYRMGMKEEAEKLFAHYLLRCTRATRRRPTTWPAPCATRCASSEAIETLRPAIYANPDNALLWNTLGTVLAEQGEMEQAMIFFDEALRLDPDFAKARYNRGNARLALGDADGRPGRLRSRHARRDARERGRHDALARVHHADRLGRARRRLGRATRSG